LLLLVGFASCAQAQTAKIRISVLSFAPARIKVEGERASPTKIWSFRHDYAGVLNLAERIENLTIKDASGLSLPVRRIVAGEYETTRAATRWSCEVKVDAPAQATDAAYVSWLTNERGLLLLGDVLPRLNDDGQGRDAKGSGANVSFDLPPQWKIASNENKFGDARYETNDVEQSSFLIGQDLRERREKVGEMEFVTVITGEWAFADEEVASLSKSVLKDYQSTLGLSPRRQVMLMLAPFPGFAAAERWSAETRGGTTILLVGRSPSKVAALAQISVPLSHELFHLWVPNGLALDGNYDWFYEGFTLYQSLRCRMRLNLSSFQDYLDVLGKAFDNYKTVLDYDKLSLVEASQRRWTGANALVYQKGLLVAFLYDLSVRRLTANKRSLDDVYRELFRLYNKAEKRSDGNNMIIKILNLPKPMQDFVRLYVESAVVVDFTETLAPFGLSVTRAGVQTHITVNNKLKSEQRSLLRKLGYNDKT
jgi:hypothetical protein